MTLLWSLLPSEAAASPWLSFAAPTPPSASPTQSRTRPPEESALDAILSNLATTASSYPLVRRYRHAGSGGGDNDSDDDDEDDDLSANQTYISPCRISFHDGPRPRRIRAQGRDGTNSTTTRAKTTTTTTTTPTTALRSLPPVQESLAAMLAARSLSRSNRSKEAWDIVRFALGDGARGRNGFVPRYVYPSDWDVGAVEKDKEKWDGMEHIEEQEEEEERAPDGDEGVNDNDRYARTQTLSQRRYFPGTRLPSPVMFNNTAPSSYLPPSRRNRRRRISSSSSSSNNNNNNNNNNKVHSLTGTAFEAPKTKSSSTMLPSSSLPSSSSSSSSSGRISAPPYHATFVLEVFYLSNQTYHDLSRLEETFEYLFEWHSYLHGGNDNGGGGGGGNCLPLPWNDIKTAEEKEKRETREMSCLYNRGAIVVHPFESIIPLHSRLWSKALRPVVSVMMKNKWTLPFDVSEYISSAWDFPGWDVYNASMYLLECHANATAEWEGNANVDDDDDDDANANASGEEGEGGKGAAAPVSSSFGRYKQRWRRRRRRRQQRDNGQTGANAGNNDNNSNYYNSNYYINNNDDDDNDDGYEMHLLRSCPFAMLDVPRLSAMARSDADLLQIGKILRDENSPVAPTWDVMRTMTRWRDESRALLRSAWNETSGTFLSMLARFDGVPNKDMSDDDDDDDDDGGGRNKNRKRLYEVMGWDALDVPTAHNFLGLWDGLGSSSGVYGGGGMGPDHERGKEQSPGWDDRVRERAAMQLVQSGGTHGFGPCVGGGYEWEYPLRSLGGCHGETSNDGIAMDVIGAVDAGGIVDPSLNYLLALGLNRSYMSGLSHWLCNSTLNVACGLPNVDSSDAPSFSSSSSSCPANVRFASAYASRGGRIFASDMCDLTSTLSAAAIYSVSLPDPAFTYRPAPPISSSGVIVLIAIELVIALAVGVSCALMSLHLRRRLKAADDEGDAFVRMARARGRADLDDLYGDEDDDGGGGGGGIGRWGGMGYGVGNGTGGRGGFIEEIDDRMFVSAPTSASVSLEGSRGDATMGSVGGGGSSDVDGGVGSSSSVGPDRFLGVPVTPRLPDSFLEEDDDDDDDDDAGSGGDGSSRIGKLGGKFSSILGPRKYGWFRRRHVDDDDDNIGAGGSALRRPEGCVGEYGGGEESLLRS